MDDRCEQEIFDSGKSICVLDARSTAAEAWVQRVATESGQRVDWHYSGGRANVLYLGDYVKVFAAGEKLMAELDGEILHVYPHEEHGSYRDGDVVPKRTIAVDTGEPQTVFVAASGR